MKRKRMQFDSFISLNSNSYSIKNEKKHTRKNTLVWVLMQTKCNNSEKVKNRINC